MATKQYKNTSNEDIDIPGFGIIPAGEAISLSGQYLPSIIVENFPGLVDTTESTEDVDDIVGDEPQLEKESDE